MWYPKNLKLKIYSLVLSLLAALNVWIAPLSAQGVLHPRIINGHDASMAPWMAALIETGASPAESAFCGGTLIGPDLILTAAHCAEYFADDPSALSVVVGRLALSSSEGTVAVVDQIIIYPNYNNTSFEGDLALLKLKSRIELESYPQLPSHRSVIRAGALLNAYGWGSIDPQVLMQPDRLQEVTIPVVANRRCESVYRSAFHQRSMFCAGILSTSAKALDGSDSCAGDSGGPIGFLDSEGFRIIGLTSWGYACASNKYWGVYTRLDRYLGWLQSDPQNAPRSIIRPTILGRPVVGRSLRCMSGEWSEEGILMYQWTDSRRPSTVLSRSSSYKLKGKDAGKSITCTVTNLAHGSKGVARARSVGPILTF